MKNNVQAYIAVVSFPTSIDELRDLADNDYYMDMEEIMLGHDVNYTAPKWAAKGDVIFFYHAKSAIVKIRNLKKQAIGQKNKDKLMEYLDLAEEIYKACGGNIFCVARVGDNPEIIKDDRENLHWPHFLNQFCFTHSFNLRFLKYPAFAGTPCGRLDAPRLNRHKVKLFFPDRGFFNFATLFHFIGVFFGFFHAGKP